MRFDRESPQLAELFRFIKFGLTGVMNTAVDFLVFTVLSWIGINVYLSQTVSYAAGMLNSYIVNRSWTFASRGRFFGSQLWRFILANLSLLLLSLFVLRLGVGTFGLSRMFAKLCTTGCTMILGFLVNRLWVFRERS